MLTVKVSRPFTPYEWLARQDAQPGDRVLMDDGQGGVAVFMIDSIDKTTKRVHYSLDGVWRNREWIAMDPRAEYILETKGE